MTTRSGQDLRTSALRTCLIVSIRAATWAVFKRISGVPGSMPAAARTSALGTRWVPVTITERTTSSREPNRTQPAAPMTPAAARAKHALAAPRASADVPH